MLKNKGHYALKTHSAFRTHYALNKVPTASAL